MRGARVLATPLALARAIAATAVAVPGARAMRSPAFVPTPAGVAYWRAVPDAADGAAICRVEAHPDQSDADCAALIVVDGQVRGVL